MGAWGSGLYANDTACDIRDIYMQCLQDGMDDLQAYEKTIAECADYLSDDVDAPLVWYALAETQWKMGRLMPEVKENALKWIDKNGGIDPWLETVNKGMGWMKTLGHLRDKLLSPMPKRKRIQKHKEPNENLWNLFDLYAYELHDAESKKRGVYGGYVVLQKIGEGIPLRESTVYMRIQMFDKIFDKLPSIDDLKDVRILPFDLPKRVTLPNDPVHMSTYIGVFKNRNYPRKYLHYIGNSIVNQNCSNFNRNLHSWCQIEDDILFYSDLWTGIKYETVSEGVFRYLSPKESSGAYPPSSLK